MQRTLTGRTIVITGASSGIGAATARVCAGAGMSVLLVARRPDRLQALADGINRASRGRADVLVIDVAEPGASSTILDAAERAHGGSLDAVFANAGYGYARRAVDETDADIRRIFDVNFFAAATLLREAGRRLLSRGAPGHLLMCSSCLSKFSLPGYGAYAATKAAQGAWCGAMRLELLGTGIEVASVHPITTVTEFGDVVDRQSGGTGVPSLSDRVPRPFVQSPERVARAVVRCLRRPRPEVWTSVVARAAAACMTFAPGLGDRAIALFARRAGAVTGPRRAR